MVLIKKYMQINTTEQLCKKIWHAEICGTSYCIYILTEIKKKTTYFTYIEICIYLQTLRFIDFYKKKLVTRAARCQ